MGADSFGRFRRSLGKKLAHKETPAPDMLDKSIVAGLRSRGVIPDPSITKKVITPTVNEIPAGKKRISRETITAQLNEETITSLSISSYLKETFKISVNVITAPGRAESDAWFLENSKEGKSSSKIAFYDGAGSKRVLLVLDAVSGLAEIRIMCFVIPDKDPVEDSIFMRGPISKETVEAFAAICTMNSRMRVAHLNSTSVLFQ